jgi:hypothetical protein
MAKTFTVGTKVEKQVHDHLTQLAAAQGKSVSEVARELIEAGLKRSVLGASDGQPEAVLDRLGVLEQQIAFHHNALGELLMKAVKAGAAARYFARLTASYGQDITSYLTTQQPLDAQSKTSQMAQFEKKCREFEQHFLMSPFDKL